MGAIRDDDTALLRLLDEGGRNRIDAAIRERGYLAGVVAVREAFLPWGGLHLYDARDMVLARFAELGIDPCPPTPPLDVDGLVARARAYSSRPREIAAVWDGDDFGWYLVLEAPCEDGSILHLGRLRRRDGLRTSTGEVPSRPEAVEGREVGTALAARLGVPFRFDHPDTPDFSD
ncbi:hypothetical protein [Nocardiopsis dassonvillei]|uniref:hypothetical protein n=1 Tax=Nocardiopsis dassonvillei TaxID=2014 RepID=UPI003F5512DF